jgi:hypothetical protein
MRKLAGLYLLIFGVLLGVHQLAAQIASSPSPINSYQVYDYGVGGMSNTAGRTLVPPPTLIGTDHVFIEAGQSHWASISASATCPGNQTSNPTKVLNLNIYDGNIYQLVNPVLGAESGDGTNVCNATNQSSFGVLGDLLLNNSVYTKIINVPVSIGGSYVSDWSASGLQNGRLRVAVLWLRSLGYLSQTDLIFMQGEADVLNANPAFGCTSTPCTTTAQWTAALQSMLATMRGLGFTGKVYVVRDTSPYSSATTCTPLCSPNISSNGTGYPNFTNIDNAQTGIIDNINFFSIANINTALSWNTDFGSSDHFNDSGNSHAAKAICSGLKGSACP